MKILIILAAVLVLSLKTFAVCEKEARMFKAEAIKHLPHTMGSDIEKISKIEVEEPKFMNGDVGSPNELRFEINLNVTSSDKPGPFTYSYQYILNKECKVNLKATKALEKVYKNLERKSQGSPDENSR